MIRYWYILFFCILGAGFSTAQKNLLIKNVTLHIGNGEVIENGALGIKKGKIDLVAKSGDNYNEKAYENVIDGKGQHVYPGLIAPNTRLGLEEVEAVRATRDYREVGVFNPSIRSIIAYNTDSQIIPTVRSNGILFAQIVPEGGRMSGQSSVVYTQADNWEDAAFGMDGGIHLHWPNRFHYSGWWAQPGPTKANKNYEKDIEGIKIWMDAAYAYAQQTTPEKIGVKMEAAKGLFDQSKTLFVHVYDAKAIQQAVETLKPYGVKIVLVGATDAWQITDFLKKNDISIILEKTHSLPEHAFSDIDQPYKTPKMLADAGIKFTFSVDGSWNQRNLPFQAGQAAAYGLTKEQAVSAITLHAAEILGISDRVGSLEKGKDGTFIVSQGDVLDMRTSIITDAYMAGKKVDLGDKQKELHEKYLEKYDLKKGK